MTQEDLQLEPREPRPPGHGRLVLAGVVGACVLGGGLGLWARPTSPLDLERATEPQPREVAGPRPALQIVVDDEPAPLGQPLEVLPPEIVAPAAPFLAPAAAAPRPAASGLMKVDVPAAAEPLPVVKLEPPPKAEARSKPEARTVKAKAEKAKVVRERTPKAEKAKLAKAKKPEKAKAAKLAKAEARPTKAKAPAKVAKAVKAAPKAVVAKAKAKARKERKIELAEAGPKVGKPKATKAKPPAKLTRKPKVEKARAPAARKPVPRGEGPMRVARAKPCASDDPGEAMVCSDSRLGARERQLQQAYRNAEAAGVPASALRRQQTRWLQARAAAAREAPWAVEDAYVARISELHDLTRDAREN